MHSHYHLFESLVSDTLVRTFYAGSVDVHRQRCIVWPSLSVTLKKTKTKLDHILHVISECSCSLADCKLFQVTSNQGKINDNALNNYV